MRLFLDVVPIDEALDCVRSIAPALPSEEVALIEAHGRILAESAYASHDIPGFTRSVVDGYAVVADDTTGAGESIPAMLTLKGRIAMGNAGAAAIGRGECMYVPTGGILPEGADSVAMIEYSEEIGDQVLVHRAVAPGENVIRRGEDYREGTTVLDPGSRISPRDLGVLAALGYAEVPVRVKPKVGIISTGNELVPPSEMPGPAQVRDANTYLCSGFIAGRGGIPVSYGIVPDERLALEQTLDRAIAECDLVLLSGGSSKDERDMCAETIGRQGEVLIHGIAIAPGKPTIIGRVGKTPVIGLPGHPASAFVVLIAIVGELLAAMSGERLRQASVQARLTLNVPSARGREDYIRVKLENEGATPIFGKSGLLNTLVESDGVIRVPAESEGLEEGDVVEVIPW